MTYNVTAPNLPTLSASDVIGPFSPWPRKVRRATPRRLAGAIATLGGLGIFAHCVVPMIA